MSQNQAKDKPLRSSGLQFSLRGVLLIMLLVATYIAGWMSHKEFNAYYLQENIVSATKRIQAAQAQVDVVEDVDGVVIARGKTPQATAEAISALKQVEKAAQE